METVKQNQKKNRNRKRDLIRNSMTTPSYRSHLYSTSDFLMMGLHGPKHVQDPL